MSTFLELCTLVASQSGGVGRAPASVTSQSGRQGKVVDFVRRAWELIQMERSDWNFMRGEWSGTLVAHTGTYTGASFNIDRFRRFLGDSPGYRPTTIYNPAIGVADEGELSQIKWERYRVSYGRGAQIEQRPTCYCLDMNGAIRFGCVPDMTYNVRGEYLKKPQILEENDDIPDMPDEFHERIVDEAIRLMSIHDEAAAALQLSGEESRKWRVAMLRELTPPIDLYAGGPIA